MEDRSSKVYFGLCMLVLIWIGVYWAWEPGKSSKPHISISQPTQQSDPNPEIDPEPVQPDPAEIKDAEQSADQQTVEILPPQSDPIQDNSPKLIPPEFTTHTVKQGEILQDIAKIHYGKTSFWSAIARANPRVDPLKLRAGMVLRIPIDPSNIQGIISNPNATDDESSDPETIVEYLVVSGDSLSLIAQKFYGSSRYADFIYESNRDVLRSKDSIRVGQTLKLPPLDP